MGPVESTLFLLFVAVFGGGMVYFGLKLGRWINRRGRD